MLFQSTVPIVFNKMAAEFDLQSSHERKKYHAKLLDFYAGLQLSHLETTLADYFADPSKLQKLCLNVTRKVIDGLASLYKTAPVREIEGSQTDKELYKTICNSSMIDVRMRQASRLCKLLKTVLLRPVWRNGAITIEILTGNLVDVIFSECPEILEKVLITDFGTSGKIEDVEYSLWSKSEFLRLDYQGNVILAEPNIYGVLPFLPVFDSLPIGAEFWPIGNQDLLLSQESINVKLTDLLHVLHHQSFGVGWIRNNMVDPLENDSLPILYGPASLIELNGKDAGLGFESQKAPIPAIVKSIDQIIRWTCVSHGLSAATMATDTSSESGLSKVWGSTELSERRAEDRALWTNYERQFFDLLRIVFNTHSGEKLSDGAELKINFSDPAARPSTSMLDEAEAHMMYYQMGVFSPVDIIMKKDSDLQSRQLALERLELIKKEREHLSPPQQFNQAARPGVKQGARS